MIIDEKLEKLGEGTKNLKHYVTVGQLNSRRECQTSKAFQEQWERGCLGSYPEQ